MRSGRGRQGFSLVEMMVALVFISILMAGMATAIKSSVTTFYTAGEKLSSIRRNHSSMDLLYDDINAIGLYLDDIQSPPDNISSTNPLFYVLPNQAVAGAPATGPQYADQIFFYLDQPFPFQGTLASNIVAGVDQNSLDQNQAIQDNAALANPSLIINCGSNSASGIYAQQVYNAFHALGEPVELTLQDSYVNVTVAGITAPSSNSYALTVQTGASANAGITGTGSVGGTFKHAHTAGASVLLFVPRQMVRYSVQMLQLDPQSNVGIPCLVRDQGNYSQAGFVANPSLQQVVTENVSAFKVYLSVNPGFLTANNPAQAWAPFNAIGNAPNFAAGWTAGVLADLNTQLAASGRAGQTSTGTSLVWFRDIPLAVRVDITTQTATQRSEYSANGATLANKTFQQSLVMVPRNFGLPLTD
jgi:prepilin-type N-terminal cleavage/methylation domain-containing protein